MPFLAGKTLRRNPGIRGAINPFASGTSDFDTRMSEAKIVVPARRLVSIADVEAAVAFLRADVVKPIPVTRSASMAAITYWIERCAVRVCVATDIRVFSQGQSRQTLIAAAAVRHDGYPQTYQGRIE
jgi:hypothetical protein